MFTSRERRFVSVLMVRIDLSETFNIQLFEQFCRKAIEKQKFESVQGEYVDSITVFNVNKNKDLSGSEEGFSCVVNLEFILINQISSLKSNRI